MSGFPRSMFVNELGAEVKFICQDCDHILRDPVQTYCGHRYCRGCFQRIIDSNETPLCQACDEEDNSILKTSEVFSDRAIARELSRIPVQCLNDMCKWTGNYKEYGKIHESTCPWALIKCIKGGCEILVRRNDLAEHLENECLMRMERCVHCNIESVFSELQKHYNECAKFPVTCKYCKMDGIPRGKLNDHLDAERGECSKKMVDCAFREVGCHALVEKDDMSQHNEQAIGEHTMCLLKRTSELNTSIQDIDRERHEIHNIKERVQTQQITVNELTAQAQRLHTQIHNNEAPSQGENKTIGATLERQSNTIDSLNNHMKSLETQVNTYEDIVGVLNNQIENDAMTVQTIQRQMKPQLDLFQTLEHKVIAQDRLLALKDLALAEQDLRIQSLIMASHDGTLVWKITDFARKRQDAILHKTLSIYSPCFYTDHHGYKMCARIYLNGDGMGKGNHVSLFFVVMRGEYDALLRWPFRQKVTLMWLDQNNREHVIDAFRPDPSSSSFQRPQQDMNVASGCPLFMPLTQLDSSRHAYVQDDVAFIRIIVDTSDIT